MPLKASDIYYNGGTDNLAPKHNPTFTGTSLILPNNSRINNIEHFYQTTKPTVRGDSSALVIGDRWWKTDTGEEWFWNGTYWLSTTINRYTSGYTSISAAGNTFIVLAAPRRGFCESLRINWNYLGGGGVNPWSSTAYFSVAIDTRNINNTFVLDLNTALNTTTTQGSGIDYPNLVWNYSDSRVFAIRVASETNDPGNGQVQFFATIRDYFP